MRPEMRLSRSRDRIPAGVIGASLAAVLLSWAAACVEQDDDKPTEDDMKVVKANILAAAPAPKYPVSGDLEGKVTYLGLDVDPPVAVPGKELKLTHYWKSVAAPGEGWRVFTHVEGPNHQSFINADHGPVGGKYAVNQWKPGQIIRDEHSIVLPPSWTHDSVLVYVGLWRGPTRMGVKAGPNDGSNRLLAATIPVKVTAKPEATRKHYVARRIEKPIKIDGKLDETAWKDAPSTGPFVNTLNGGPVDQKSEAKLLWDDKFLYVAFENSDTDVWSSLTKRDDKLWTQEAVELMIDADRNGKTYVEVQVAPNGNIFDAYLPLYRKYEDTVDPKAKPYSWNAKIQAKVFVDGTLNKHDDTDRGWNVELALPLTDVKGMDPKAELTRLPPVVGDTWRMNMFRMDVPQGKGQQASGWSPPLVGDFHALDRFGDLIFGDDKGNPTSRAASAGAPGGVAQTTGAAGKLGGPVGAAGGDKAVARARRRAAKAENSADKARP